MKKWGLILFAVLGLSLPGWAAQSVAMPPLSNGNPSTIRLENLTLDKNEYAVGATVKGHFTLQNVSSKNMGEVKYLVSLVGLDGTGHAPGIIYERQQSTLLDVAGNARKEIDFAYPITSAPAAGDALAIHVRVAMKDGAALASGMKAVKVTGGITMVKLQEGGVLVNNQENHEDWPVVTGTGTVTFNLKLLNPGKEDFKLHPEMTLLDKARNEIKGTYLKSGSPFVIKAGCLEGLKIGLPIEGLPPEMYLAQVRFVDADGKPRSGYYYAQYAVQ